MPLVFLLQASGVSATLTGESQPGNKLGARSVVESANAHHSASDNRTGQTGGFCAGPPHGDEGLYVGKARNGLDVHWVCSK